MGSPAAIPFRPGRDNGGEHSKTRYLVRGGQARFNLTLARMFGKHCPGVRKGSKWSFGSLSNRFPSTPMSRHCRALPEVRVRANCVEKVENAASAELAQLSHWWPNWQAMPSQSAWEGHGMNQLRLKRSPHPGTPSAPEALRKSAPTLERTFSTQSANRRHRNERGRQMRRPHSEL